MDVLKAAFSVVGVYPILIVVAVVVVLASLVWALDLLAARVERQEEEARRIAIRRRVIEDARRQPWAESGEPLEDPRR